MLSLKVRNLGRYLYPSKVNRGTTRCTTLGVKDTVVSIARVGCSYTCWLRAYGVGALPTASLLPRMEHLDLKDALVGRLCRALSRDSQTKTCVGKGIML
jgi:hypothetical protein